MKRILCTLLAMVFLMSLSVSAVAAETGWTPDVEFTTVDTEGKEWTDHLFAEASLTMVNLWAYWCPPCVGELPDLQRLSEDYTNLQVIGVSPAEYEAENIETMQELGITYPTLRLTQSLNLKMNTGYIPATMFVDSQGHILGEVLVGSRSYEEWAALIEEYLPEEETVPEDASAEKAAEESGPQKESSGWNLSVPTEITEEVQALFDQAMDGLVGVDYTPVAVLGEAESDGTLCILCKATVVYPGAEPYNALVYVNEEGVRNIYELWIEEHAG